jgi:hypothetical protein
VDGRLDQLLYQLLLFDLGLEHLHAPLLVQLIFALLTSLLLHDVLCFLGALFQLFGPESIVL